MEVRNALAETGAREGPPVLGALPRRATFPARPRADVPPPTDRRDAEAGAPRWS